MKAQYKSQLRSEARVIGLSCFILFHFAQLCTDVYTNEKREQSLVSSSATLHFSF